jgi:hypothetical protein
MYKTIKRSENVEDFVQSLMNYNNYNFLARNHFMIIIDKFLFIFRNDEWNSFSVSKIESYEVCKDGTDCTIHSSKNSERFTVKFEDYGIHNKSSKPVVSFDDQYEGQLDNNYKFYKEYRNHFNLGD